MANEIWAPLSGGPWEAVFGKSTPDGMVTRHFNCKECGARVSATDYPMNLTGGVICNQCGSEIA